jgi:hypothetical protein|nr:hypothetical protein [uncultured Methanoregula sp.]
MTRETNRNTGNSTSSVSSPVYRDGLRAQIELLDEISLKLDEYFMLTRFRENDNDRR